MHGYNGFIWEHHFNAFIFIWGCMVITGFFVFGVHTVITGFFVFGVHMVITGFFLFEVHGIVLYLMHGYNGALCLWGAWL